MTCVVCGAASPRSKLHTGGVEIFECGGCGLAFWDPGPDFAPDRVYDEGYFADPLSDRGYDDYKRLEIRAIAAEYQDGLRRLRADVTEAKLVIWLGSSIGNLDRPSAARFMAGLRSGLNSSDRLLLGIDLRKDRDVLECAYNDSSGVTARFNRNLLERINRELGGHFDPQAFDFRASYDEARGTVESHLLSRTDQLVEIDDLGLRVRFSAGEAIHTESSYKYSLEEIESLARSANLELREHWLDSERRFSVNLFAAGVELRAEASA